MLLKSLFGRWLFSAFFGSLSLLVHSYQLQLLSPAWAEMTCATLKYEIYEIQNMRKLLAVLSFLSMFLLYYWRGEQLAGVYGLLGRGLPRNGSVDGAETSCQLTNPFFLTTRILGGFQPQHDRNSCETVRPRAPTQFAQNRLETIKSLENIACAHRLKYILGSNLV